MIYNKRR